MRNLQQIHAVYAQIDADLESKRSAALGNQTAISKIDETQRINDQAYYVLCWGQLETAIDEACRDALRVRQASGNWAIRRAWDLYNPNDRRLSGLRFEDRAALVLDRQAGSGSPWAKVMQYYALRNQVAHGGLLAQRIDVDAIVAEFFHIQSRLQT